MCEQFMDVPLPQVAGQLIDMPKVASLRAMQEMHEVVRQIRDTSQWRFSERGVEFADRPSGQSATRTSS